MNAPPNLKTGDRVKVTYAGQTVLGSVLLASPNSKSLVLVFDAMLAGYIGMMPVLWNDELTRYEDLITRRPVSASAF